MENKLSDTFVVWTPLMTNYYMILNVPSTKPLVSDHFSRDIIFKNEPWQEDRAVSISILCCSI